MADSVWHKKLTEIEFVPYAISNKLFIFNRLVFRNEDSQEKS
jgi:hypothetical protein